MVLRGYPLKVLKKEFTEEARSFKDKALNREIKLAEKEEKEWLIENDKEGDESEKMRLFFHIEFNPSDINKNKIWGMFDEKLGDILCEHVNIHQFTIALHRSRNLRDNLIPSTLHLPKNITMSKMIKDRANGNQS